LFKGCNIQELLVGDSSVGDTSTLHPGKWVRRELTREKVRRAIIHKARWKIPT
jgi:hypothetical protein